MSPLAQSSEPLRSTVSTDAAAPRRPTARRWVVIAAFATLALVGAVLAVTLSSSAPRLAGTNDVRLDRFPVAVGPGSKLCQRGERVPPDAARLVLVAGTEGRPGPPLLVTVGSADVRVPGGYADLSPVSVPLPEAAGGAREFCVENRGSRRVFLGGQDARVQLPPLAVDVDGKQQAVAVSALYYRAGEETWWSVAGSVLRRWGYVTAFGAATPWIALALFLVAGALAVVTVIRGRTGPLAVGVVAFAAAAGWAFTTPVFHVGDEPQHFAYAQYLLETGRLPTDRPVAVFSEEEAVVFRDVEFNSVAGNRTGRPPWSAEQDEAIDAELSAPRGRVSEGGESNAVNNPPLYYAAQGIPYLLTSGGDFLDRLLAMRLFSALLAGVTAAMAFLFLREVLPRPPWAPVAGGLVVALQPLFGFISGGVNNDAGLFAASAALLWLVARALRRGLDTPTAIGIGLALGLGAMTKLTILAFIPGLIVCAALLVVRAGPARAAMLRRVLLAAAIAIAPIVLYVALDTTVWDRPLWMGVAGTGTPTGRAASLRENLSYLWQFYLPRLPFMTDQQAGLPLYNLWFKGFIGNFGWLDTPFTPWVYTVAALLYMPVLALAGVALWMARTAVRGRRGEILVWATMSAGLVVMVGVLGYRGRLSNGFIFEQARYLLPLLALYGGIVALAVRGAGRRAGHAVAAVVVVLALGHTVAAALLVIGRYYG